MIGKQFSIKLSLTICLFIFSLFSLSSQAADEAWNALQKTAFAARELNYQGIFVYQNGNQVRSVQITHMNNAGQEFTRNALLDGKPREVFSQGSEIVIFHPKNDKVVIEKRRGQNLFPAMLPTDLQAIKTSYTAKLSSIDNVAGRKAQIIELIPNDAYRYSYKIWSDLEYGLLVKMASVNKANETLEQITFSQLSIMNTQDLNWYQPKIDAKKKYVMEEVVASNHVTSNWIVTELPPGYSKIDHISLAVPGKAQPVDQVIYSDGIASVSLFIEQIAKGSRPKKGHMLVGSTNICADVASGYQITVVGEVPEETVRQIAKAVTFKKHTASNK
jgi:sigma-E factor negative regulatory protein RseB